MSYANIRAAGNQHATSALFQITQPDFHALHHGREAQQPLNVVGHANITPLQALAAEQSLTR